MSCQKCKSIRVLELYGKCSDLAVASMSGFDYEHDGYAPEIPNVCGGDDIQFEVCLECGQMQGEWPVSKTTFEKECKEYQEKLSKEIHESLNFKEDEFFKDY